MIRFRFSDDLSLRIAHKVNSRGRALLLRVDGDWIEVETEGDDYFLGTMDAGPISGAIRSIPTPPDFKTELAPRASLAPIIVRKGDRPETLTIEANPDTYDVRPVYAKADRTNAPAREADSRNLIPPRVSPPPGGAFTAHYGRKRK